MTTHVFDSIDKYLDGDAVFGVKNSLITEFTEHKTKDAAAEKFGAEPPFCTCEFDFVLAPASSRQINQWLLKQKRISPKSEQILQSKALRTSEVHRTLLNYLAEKSLSGEADNLKEYTVGLDVFAKPESYDPRQESVVRMHMARLRQKLAEYRTGARTIQSLWICPRAPSRSPLNRVRLSVHPEAPAEPEIIEIPASSTSKRALILMAVLLLAAVAFASYFGLRLRQVERTTAVLTAANYLDAGAAGIVGSAAFAGPAASGCPGHPGIREFNGSFDGERGVLAGTVSGGS